MNRGISLFACRADARRRVRRAHPASEVGANQWHRQPRQVGRSRRAPSYPLGAIGAILAAILVAGTLAFAAIDPFGLRGPSVEAVINPALRDAGAQWELQRRQQVGDIDPLTEAQRDGSDSAACRA